VNNTLEVGIYQRNFHILRSERRACAYKRVAA
jgi:hypothetical protein